MSDETMNITSGVTGVHVGDICGRCGRPYHGSAGCESFTTTTGFCASCGQRWVGVHECPVKSKTFGFGGLVSPMMWCGVEHPHAEHRWVQQIGLYAECPGSTGPCAAADPSVLLHDKEHSE